jgi:molybdopterin-synthase adenylyltransferase
MSEQPQGSPAPHNRYSRQSVLPQIGEDGQRKLGEAAVLVAGAGALGSSIAEILARAGVGLIRIADRDYLELHNLQRQTLYTEADVESGLPKAAAAAEHLRRINSTITVEPHVVDITRETIEPLIGGVSVILDGTDNLQTRYLLNDAALRWGIPWVYSGVIGVCGVSMTVVGGDGPCLRCLYPAAPPPGATETCDVAGVLGPAAQLVAASAAAEAIKRIVGGPPAKGLMVADLWVGSTERMEVPRNPDCPACVHGVYDYLDADEWDRDVVRLCGRDAVQVRFGLNPDLADLGSRLQAGGVGEVLSNPYLVRLRTPEHELTLFADGRAIVKGTEDASVARGLLAKYIGT